MSFFSIAKGFHKLSKHPPPQLTHIEMDRLRAITIYKRTKDVCLVCKTYGISRENLELPKMCNTWSILRMVGGILT